MARCHTAGARRIVAMDRPCSAMAGRPGVLTAPARGRTQSIVELFDDTLEFQVVLPTFTLPTPPATPLHAGRRHLEPIAASRELGARAAVPISSALLCAAGIRWRFSLRVRQLANTLTLQRVQTGAGWPRHSSLAGAGVVDAGDGRRGLRLHNLLALPFCWWPWISGKSSAVRFRSAYGCCGCWSVSGWRITARRCCCCPAWRSTCCGVFPACGGRMVWLLWLGASWHRCCSTPTFPASARLPA